MERIDCLIVGQGIAGTLLTRHLLRLGLTVRIIDEGHRNAASAVAAGIINPITGRQFVRSWRVHEFLPFAIDEYTAIGVELGEPVFRLTNLLRAITSVEEENTWTARTADPLVRHFMLPEYDLAGYDGLVRPAFSYGELTGTCQVFLPRIIRSFARRWSDEGLLRTERFDHEALQPQNGRFHYRDLSTAMVVFCEGCQAASNPFFPDAGLAPTKGEVLHVHIEGALPEKMYKDGIFLVPQPGGSLWVGGGYAWNPSDSLPTPGGKAAIEQELHRILKVPFTVLRHQAAIRPTMHGRRPVLRAHAAYEGMFLFNGLGTKGASMAPLITAEVARAITAGPPFASLLYR